MAKWISVKKRLPKLDQVVDLWIGARLPNCYRVYVQEADGWLWCMAEGSDEGVPLEALGYPADETDNQVSCVTHWMPLPDPPEASHES